MGSTRVAQRIFRREFRRAISTARGDNFTALLHNGTTQPMKTALKIRRACGAVLILLVFSVCTRNPKVSLVGRYHLAGPNSLPPRGQRVCFDHPSRRIVRPECHPKYRRNRDPHALTLGLRPQKPLDQLLEFSNLDRKFFLRRTVPPGGNHP